jgi:hypothetical protein
MHTNLLLPIAVNTPPLIHQILDIGKEKNKPETRLGVAF